MQPPILRLVADADSDGIIALIESCYAEYPPNVLLVDEEEPELRTPESSFDRFWVLDDGGEIVGTVAAVDHGEFVELKKMYLAIGMRGSGWAQKLQLLVIDFARTLGKEMELWTDTRFERAHSFYQKCGWKMTGESRELHDASQTTEYRFIRVG